MSRILHLIPHLEEGGAQRQLAYALSLSASNEHEVASLIAPEPQRLFPSIRSLRVPFHYLSHTHDFYAREILPALRTLLRRGKFDLVHCWMFESIIQGCIAASLEGVRCLAAPHALLDGFRYGRRKMWEKRMIRKTLQLPDLVLFPSHTMAIEYTAAGWVDPGRVRVVQNGVDCDSFAPEGEGDALVTVGRISVEKGYGELLSLVRNLRAEVPGLRCIAAGGGEAIGGDIEFTGFVDDVRTVLRKGAVYVTTSPTEGLSCSLLEAQAMGLPAVARRIGSNSEVIEDGVNGFLAGSNEEFAERCGMLLQDPGLRKAMGQKARERMVNNFSIHRQVQKIEMVHSELLQATYAD